MTAPDEFTRDHLRSRFIDTYDPPGELDPHELVADYDAYTEYIARNPNAGSYAVASAIDAPRGRVRPWMEDDAMPDAARGVFTAERHGWFATSGPTHRALTRLVASVFAGGSIEATNYAPTFSTGNAEIVADALREVGVGVEQVTRDRPESGDELRPARNGVALGRLLAVRGAPVGPKTDVDTVPPYLFADDQGAAADAFLDTYVLLRAVRPAGKLQVQILEHQRTIAYHDSLKRLFDARIDGEIRRGVNGIRIPDTTSQNTLWLSDAVETLSK